MNVTQQNGQEAAIYAESYPMDLKMERIYLAAAKTEAASIANTP